MFVTLKENPVQLFPFLQGYKRPVKPRSAYRHQKLKESRKDYPLEPPEGVGLLPSRAIKE